MNSMKKIKRSLCAWLSIILAITMLMHYQTEQVQAAVVLQSSAIKNYVESKVGQSYPNAMCVQFIEECYQALGAVRPYSCCASKSGNDFIRSSSSANIPVGATVYFGNCGGGPCRRCGSSYYGHAGIYVGNGYFVHATGGRVQKSTLSSWANKYRGYGYCGNFTLADDSGQDSCSCSTSYAGNYTVTANGALNMRSGHGTGFAVVAAIPTGTVVRVTKSDGQWAHVEWNGSSGYCTMQYLSKVNPVGAPQIQTWISDTKMGSTSSSFQKGNWYYLCYRLIDLKSGKLYSEAGGQEDYSVTETIYNPDGSTAVTQNYGKSDNNWVAVRANNIGTYKGVIKVTGGFEGTSTVTFDISQNVNPSIRVWFSDSKMGNGLTSGTKGNTYYLCYELSDRNTNKRLNDTSPGKYKATETIYKPDGSRVFSYAYDQSDYNWIRSSLDGTGTYRGTVQAVIDGKTVEGSAQIKISEPVIERQDLYYGDLNGDGRATAVDVSMIIKAANGSVTLTADEKKRADLNGDGYVDKKDVELMQNFIVGLINEFPVESQLGSISITREPSKTTYTVGETLSTAGMTVTAKYNNGKSKTVTGYQVNGSTSSAGRQQVKVSYTEGGITKSASFYIQVNRRQVKTATLTYDANGGTGAPGAQTAEVNSSIRLSGSRPVKSYTVYLNAGGGTVTPGKIQLKAQFAGWTTNRTASGGLYQPGAAMTLSSDTTLYAYYTAVRLGDLPTPSASMDGYTFKGWYYGASKVSANTKIGADCELTAKWEKNTHVHTPGDWVTISEATAALYGRQVKKCTVCGTILQEKIIPIKESISDDKPDGGKEQTDGKTDTKPDGGKDQTGSSETNGDAGLVSGELEEIKDSNIGSDKDKADQDLSGQDNKDQDNKNQTDQNKNGQDQSNTDLGDENTDEKKPDSDDIQQGGGQEWGDSDSDFWTDDNLSDGDDDEEDDWEDDDEDSYQDDGCSVEWNTASAVLQKGKVTTAVKAYVTGDDEIVRYQTSDPSVVAVSSSGQLKGKKTGRALVRVVTKRGNTATVKIKVQKGAVKTKKISVNKKKLRLKAGKVFRLETEVAPITSSQEIRYLSSDSKVAAVNKQGQIKAKKKGTAVIRVKSGKKTVKVTVTVRS